MFRKGDTVVHPDHGAAVIEDLCVRELFGEKRMITKARQILVSELTFATGGDEEKAEAMIDKVLDDSHGARAMAQA